MVSRRGAVPIVWGLLLAVAAGCEPPPELGIQGSYAARQNHPNSLVATRLKEEPPRYPLRFVLLSDTHFPFGSAVFAQLRTQILQLDPPPAFAINIGDCVDTGAVEEHVGYMSIIDAFPIPIFSVIGNHEMYPGNRKNYRLFYGPEDFSFDYAETRFIALNDIVPRRDGLTDLQIKFLEHELATAPPNRFVFMHAPPPLLPPPWGAPAFFNIERFYELVERFGVKLVGVGHVHEYKNWQVNGVHYVETGGGGGRQDLKLAGLQNPPSQAILHNFVLITIEANGETKVELIPQGDTPQPLTSFTIRFQVAPATTP